MCDAVNNIKPENSDAMISMIVAGDNIRLSSGREIAGCKKYEANCPTKLQPGFWNARSAFERSSPNKGS